MIDALYCQRHLWHRKIFGYVIEQVRLLATKRRKAYAKAKLWRILCKSDCLKRAGNFQSPFHLSLHMVSAENCPSFFGFSCNSILGF
jgi:hypothetical protein